MPMNQRLARAVGVRLLRALLLCSGLLLAPAAHAGICLLCVCTATTTPIVFPAINPLVASNGDSVGNVRIACGGVVSVAITYSVALSAGASNAMAARQMVAGSKRLNYNVYVSNAYSSVWGDGSGATQVRGGVLVIDALGLSSPQDLPVYGRIPGGQAGVAPGAYVDTLIVTLTYN